MNKINIRILDMTLALEIHVRIILLASFLSYVTIFSIWTCVHCMLTI